jgi:hypothetical protein
VKVVASVGNKVAQQCFGYTLRVAFHHGGMQFIEAIEQDHVLIVNGWNPDRKLVVPRQ